MVQEEQVLVVEVEELIQYFQQRLQQGGEGVIHNAQDLINLVDQEEELLMDHQQRQA